MNWNEGYNSGIGLWESAGPGHTIPTKDLDVVHVGPNAASRLLAAAQLDELSQIDVPKVLAALRAMLWEGEGPTAGCMRWYWEEDQPYDTNAAFFTGLSLIILKKQFEDLLDEASRVMLDGILAGLNVWFQHAIDDATIYYPNKFLGDLVCGWMLLEIRGEVGTDTVAARRMHEAADDWLANGWGWGEHLSDIYAGVCLNELSVLLLLAEQLPDDLRSRYNDLIGHLLTIEDAFDGGPRVPALRSYAFQAPESHVNYRDRVKPWERAPAGFGNSPDLGNLLAALNWHDRIPARGPRQRNPAITCFGGTIAKAHIEDDMRIGSVSRFPVMPSAEHATWGLSWQCFPVALSRGETDWGFLQWETEESGTLCAHPANGGAMAHVPKSLTTATTAPLMGHTYAIQRSGRLLVLRVMPVIPTVWDGLTDRFRLVGATAEISEQTGPAWSRLKLTYPEREVFVCSVDLDSKKPVLSPNEFGGTDWSIAYSSSDLAERRLIAHLWGFAIDDDVSKAPSVEVVDHGPSMARTPEESIRQVEWSWSSEVWHIRIDPLSDNPLTELP